MSNGKKLAIVTGANKGIGLQIVRNLCSSEDFDGTVLLTSRDVVRGQNALELLVKEGLRPAYHQLDITDESSCQKLADYVKAEYGGIDILVNNAGFAMKQDATEPFALQAEVTLKINYYGLLTVSKHLEPLLRPHARVVNVSSSASLLKRVTNEDIKKRLTSDELTQSELDEIAAKWLLAAKDGKHVSRGWPNSAYCASKIFVTAFTKIQQRRFNADSREDLIANAVHPGWVQTDMTGGKGHFTVVEGARSATYAALLPQNTASPKGELIWHDTSIADWLNQEGY